ncbi:MAG: lysophospholipase, partial [Bacteroidota bacterium]
KIYSRASRSDAYKSTVLLIHGLGEHCRRYDHFVEYLSHRDIGVVTFDLHGHGRSDGDRGYLPNANTLIGDIETVCRHYSLASDTYLMGHSLGGLIAVHHCIVHTQRKWRGLITTGAALEVDKDLSPILQFLAPLLGALFPKLKTTPLDITYLTRSEIVRNAYLTDPLVYRDGMRARTGALSLRLIKQMRQRFDEVRLPMLVMHGGADRLTMPEGTQLFFDRSSSQDKSIEIWEGLYHELINEPEQESVMDKIATWITSRS